MNSFFECKSCGYVIVSEEDPRFCPMCRSSMKKIPEIRGNFTEVQCPSCGRKFSYPVVKPPYKCAFCNYTFPKTPFRVQEEKL
uniref:DZANK-type domain-containing protein n=1 Tax=candidate division WOR-3 bacterium TaxID=2052148 RepID=A0A7C2P8E4_UNCW3